MAKKGVNIYICWILILFFIFLLGYQNRLAVENFANAISFHNWWGEPSDQDKTIFENIFGGLPQDKHIQIYSVFGDSPTPTTATDSTAPLRVQFSGEIHNQDPKLFDVNFVPDSTATDPGVISFPFGFYHLLDKNTDISIFTKPRQISLDEISRKKFCLFAVSNEKCAERNQFFQELSKYKKVDSCGKYMNNLGYRCPSGYSSNEYSDFISQYKFMICFENGSRPNYFTEKLFNSYMNGTIPIYWGCPNLGDYINMSAILYLKPGFNDQDVQDLIGRIKELDTNDTAYQQYYNSILFKDGQIPDGFNIEKIQERVGQIVSSAGNN